MVLKWVTTGGGDHGEWIVKTEDGKTAGGEWWEGGWRVNYDDTVVDIDWDALLDQCDFWQGSWGSLDDVNTDPIIGEWDGETLTVISL